MITLKERPKELHMTVMRNIVGSILACWMSIAVVFAQEHPFIAHYDLSELSGGINIDWTIQGGSTCNGQAVERSTNGVDFTAVHSIGGICGDPNAAVSYHYFDGDPPELSTVYYRIQLGFEGYSSIKFVVFDQLVTSDQRFYPSPTNGEATLLLNVPLGTMVELRIWDASGALVHEQIGATGGRIPIRLISNRAGVYTYQASGDGKVFKGRFVKY